MLSEATGSCTRRCGGVLSFELSRASLAASRPWISIISPTDGPTASATASTIATARSSSSRSSCFQAVAKGSNFSAL